MGDILYNNIEIFAICPEVFARITHKFGGTDYYDLILMDIQMPRMDGFEAARRICAMKRPDKRPDAVSVPIFAMNGILNHD